MKEMNQNSVGLALGAFAGLWHVAWSLLVSASLAKPLLDFILSKHFLSISYTLAPFSLQTALALVIVAALVGYAVGWVFATLWNWSIKMKK